MNGYARRIIKEVAEGAASYANRHKKVIGGVGAAGAAGALGYDSMMDFGRKSIGLGKKLSRVNDAVENAESVDDGAVPAYPSVHPETLRYKP